MTAWDAELDSAAGRTRSGDPAEAGWYSTHYQSTRGAAANDPLGFSDILLEGLAEDGGLYWPLRFPHLDAKTRSDLRFLLAATPDETGEATGYAAVAAQVLAGFVAEDDIPATDLLAICRRAYTPAKFGHAEIVPVSDLGDGLWLAHLSNGPTAAFKDLAMQLLGELFEYELSRRDRHITILGATSGDTGSAAEMAMLGKQRVKVFMLSPQDRMTAFQRGQMYGIDDPGIINITVPGSFDDCQDLVKQVNADAEFKQRYAIGAVNSINWARLAAQVVYYIVSWLRVSRHHDDPVSFCVPTGNFGNIIAAHIARQMGVPIKRIILATNENNVLAEYFNTGHYRVRAAAETYATSSPSMDISKASNFERFVFDLLDRDAAQVAHLFGSVLPATGALDLSAPELRTKATGQFAFSAASSSHADRVATIRSLYQRTGILIDPHTADGVKVGAGYTGQEPVICMETALPIKFADTITEAIGSPAPLPERFAEVLQAPPHTVALSGGSEQLKQIIAQRA